MKFTDNQLRAVCLGMLLTIGGWYELLLLTQKDINIKHNHYIGLCFALLIQILWWFKFIYTTDIKN